MTCPQVNRRRRSKKAGRLTCPALTPGCDSISPPIPVDIRRILKETFGECDVRILPPPPALSARRLSRYHPRHDEFVHVPANPARAQSRKETSPPDCQRRPPIVGQPEVLGGAGEDGGGAAGGGRARWVSARAGAPVQGGSAARVHPVAEGGDGGLPNDRSEG